MSYKLVTGKTRKVLHKVFKSQEHELKVHGNIVTPFVISNVRMYVSEDEFNFGKPLYKFEIDVTCTIPTYEGAPGFFRWGNNRYLSSMLRSRFSYRWQEFQNVKNKCLMFSGDFMNTYVEIKKISFIRNNTPPTLSNS